MEASKRWINDGITANALMPGGVRTPGVARIQITSEQITRLNETRTGYPDIIWKTPQLGAATSVLLATSPLLNGIGGRYFENCNEVGPRVAETQSGVASYAIDPDAAEELWKLSMELINS